jgi:hypothetical protein
MQISRRTLGILLVLAFLFVGIAVLIFQFFPSRSGFLPRPAVPLTEPVTTEISAELGWQTTGVLLESGKTIHFQFMSGEIRDGEAVIRGPAGTGYICGGSGCCEPIPDVRRDALIGRAGDYVFPIGDKTAVEVRQSGELQLRINDCDDGLFDNSGSLIVKISP